MKTSISVYILLLFSSLVQHQENICLGAESIPGLTSVSPQACSTARRRAYGRVVGGHKRAIFSKQKTKIPL